VWLLPVPAIDLNNSIASPRPVVAFPARGLWRGNRQILPRPGLSRCLPEPASKPVGSLKEAVSAPHDAARKAMAGWRLRRCESQIFSSALSWQSGNQDHHISVSLSAQRAKFAPKHSPPGSSCPHRALRRSGRKHRTRPVPPWPSAHLKILKKPGKAGLFVGNGRRLELIVYTNPQHVHVRCFVSRADIVASARNKYAATNTWNDIGGWEQYTSTVIAKVRIEIF
jgi:hypothetical protein